MQLSPNDVTRCMLAKKTACVAVSRLRGEIAVRFYGKLENVFNLHPITKVSLIATSFRKFYTSRREM